VSPDKFELSIEPVRFAFLRRAQVFSGHSVSIADAASEEYPNRWAEPAQQPGGVSDI